YIYLDIVQDITNSLSKSCPVPSKSRPSPSPRPIPTLGWTIETRCLFRRFFIVLPKTLLFMSLKKSFLKSFFALARRAVFISIYIFGHCPRYNKFIVQVLSRPV